MELPDNNASSATARLADARLKQWHQQGEALLTIENARAFLNAAGLVVFAPRPQIAAPAPSFVEAVLGSQNATPGLAEIAQARELLARLVAEGLAVPLNLLGIGSLIGRPGDVPDFVASAQVFSYIFTLRGDKAWKQPPQPTGAVRFSNLAVAAHEALTQRGPLTAYDLAGELGKEVTESAVLRALGELWAHLRVLPLPQADGRATLWELATARFIKQIKAGANAGLPTALSALVSLYLGQAIVATEDEVESFLSPLAARSRIRDVLHALVAARQLDTVAVEGRTMLHVAGAAPAFLSEEKPHTEEKADVLSEFAAVEAAPPAAEAAEAEAHGEIQPAEPGSRIAKFVPGRKPNPRELEKAAPAKFVRKPSGEKKPFAPRGGQGRPPFRDEKTSRPFQERRGFQRAEESSERSRPRFEKKRFAPGDAKPKPRFERRDRESARPERERRPFASEDRGGEDRKPRKFAGREGGGREERRPFHRPEERRGDRSGRPARKPFGRPDRFAPKRELASGEERPKREFRPKPFGGSKPFGRRSGSGSGAEEKSRPGGFGGKRPFAKPSGFGKPFRGKERADGARAGRESRFTGKKSGGAKFGNGPKFGAKKFGGKKPFGKPRSGRGPKPSGESEA